MYYCNYYTEDYYKLQLEEIKKGYTKIPKVFTEEAKLLHEKCMEAIVWYAFLAKDERDKFYGEAGDNSSIRFDDVENVIPIYGKGNFAVLVEAAGYAGMNYIRDIVFGSDFEDCKIKAIGKYKKRIQEKTAIGFKVHPLVITTS